jgi:hypothetical protein
LVDCEAEVTALFDSGNNQGIWWKPGATVQTSGSQFTGWTDSSPNAHGNGVVIPNGTGGAKIGTTNTGDNCFWGEGITTGNYRFGQQYFASGGYLGTSFFRLIVHKNDGDTATNDRICDNYPASGANDGEGSIAYLETPGAGQERLGAYGNITFTCNAAVEEFTAGYPTTWQYTLLHGTSTGLRIWHNGVFGGNPELDVGVSGLIEGILLCGWRPNANLNSHGQIGEALDVVAPTNMNDAITAIDTLNRMVAIRHDLTLQGFRTGS